MITPLHPDGAVDLAGAEELASWLVEQGSNGLVVTGTTGEVPTLSDDEKVSLWRAVLGAVGGRAKVIAGSGTNDTAHAVHLTKAAAQVGVDGALIVTPYYNRPPQRGLVEHFSAVAKATGLPLILYDIPSRTGRKIEHATLLELASVPNIVAVKDSAGDVQGASRLVAEAPETFQLYCGNDADTLPWLAVGAVGTVAVASHVAGPRMAEMISAFKRGDNAEARRIHLSLMGVFDVMGIVSNPIPVKAAMGLLGKPAGPPRLPLVPATEAETGRIRTVLEGAGLL